MKYLLSILTLFLLLGLTSAAFAYGGGRAGGFSAPSWPSGGGFDFGSDVSASRPAATGRPSGGGWSNSTTANRPSGGGWTNSSNASANRTNSSNTNVNRPTNYNTNVNRNVNVNNVNVNRAGVVVANPAYRGPAWGWNHGAVWAPAPAYWGGGFWGAWAIGVSSVVVGAAVYGSVVNASNQTITSYQVQQSSPGANLLQNYQLTQAQCGPSNLVVMYGPNNSVICAYPNNTVSAGNYTIDASTLSLVSQ